MIDIDMVIRRLRIAKEMGIITFDWRGRPKKKQAYALLSRASGIHRRTLRRWGYGIKKPSVSKVEKLDRVLRAWGY